jgi:hypothetical protein
MTLKAQRTPMKIHPHMLQRTPPRARYSRRLALLFVIGAVASGCGAGSPREPSVGAQREVARQFAVAIFRGQAATAVGLLADRHDPALIWLTGRAARPWKASHASVRLPGRRAGHSWVFGYAGTRAHRDGSFEQVRGDIVVGVAASPGRAGVESFALPHPTIRFGTHHDSVLLPSNR